MKATERLVDGKTKEALRFWIVLNRAQSSIAEILRKQVEAHGLSFTEFGVLEALLHKGALPIGEVGERVLRTSGSMTYVIDKLERRGLIHRRACEEDRRVIYAELTADGRALIGDVFPEHASALRSAVDVLSESELRQAAELIKQAGLCARTADASAHVHEAS